MIAAGERWDGDGESLRPAIEDMVGAGAILAALRPTAPSPEAIAAIAVHAAAAAALHPFIAACSSGRELLQLGYAPDIDAAVQHDVSEAVPLLRDGAFTQMNLSLPSESGPGVRNSPSFPHTPSMAWLSGR